MRPSIVYKKEEDFLKVHDLIIFQKIKLGGGGGGVGNLLWLFLELS